MKEQHPPAEKTSAAPGAAAARAVPLAGAAPTEQEPPLEKLLRYCDDSDGSCYGSLATDLVRKLVIDALASPARPAAVQREFIQHTPDADGWSEWVCPAPDSYLMKCCDCGLVHELQFRVAQYAAPRPSEEFDICADPQLQAQFRARRAEGALASPAAQPTSVFDELIAFAETSEVKPTFADAVRIALAAKKHAAQPTSAATAEPKLRITLRQAERLLAFFGGHDCDMTVVNGLPDQPPGLYVWCTEYPEEGADYLGPTEVDDELAANGRPAVMPQQLEGMTLRQRCDTALQCVPDAPLRAQLARLFEDLLAAAVMPQPVDLQEVAARIKKLGLEIFDGPECSQDVRDAIEWFAAELSVTKLPTPASEVAQDAARYRFLFLEEDWCRDPLWPLVAFFRDGNSIPKAQVDAAIDAALNQGERHGDSGSKTA